ncbi:ABC-2 type transport system permease protein [Ureibacillus xyleni]|uniref:ABC-2 type transport system permease protein n=1 Tax=Ureibacillus xyleni TaxID=614648 RepID=A0A285TH82_9BACL|nr:ABC transporter permease [Ureibacillus xyleni]SOC21108.1 ABC-2 type transport system permease protein [Ureibacillus xyleni]
MFLALIQKQIKLLLRSPSELLILLVMPIGLIFILSYALGPLMEGDTEISKVEIALVQHGNQEEQVEAFIQMAKDFFPITDELKGQITGMLPVKLLEEQIMENEELKEFVHITKVSESKIDETRNEKEFSAIIEIPENFTFDFLSYQFLNGEKPSFSVYLNEGEQITASIVQTIIDDFQHQYTLNKVLSENGLLSQGMIVPTPEISSTIKTIQSQGEITSKIYYTFSMAVMFILFIAGTIASQSFLEKDTHIFDRILLARIHPITYLSSIIVSTVILAMLQTMILFTFAYFIFDITFNHFDLYLLLTFLLAMVIGGIAAVLSSLNYRYNSASASNVFSNALVAILALLGGSFFNISSLSPGMAKIGMWTPNGAALDGYLKLAQQVSLSDLLPNITNLAILLIALIVLAFLLFPKRGGLE